MILKNCENRSVAERRFGSPNPRAQFSCSDRSYSSTRSDCAPHLDWVAGQSAPVRAFCFSHTRQSPVLNPSVNRGRACLWTPFVQVETIRQTVIEKTAIPSAPARCCIGQTLVAGLELRKALATQVRQRLASSAGCEIIRFWPRCAIAPPPYLAAEPLPDRI